MWKMNKFKKGSADGLLLGMIAAFVVIIFLFFLFAWPQYKVWQQGMAGQAQLSKAQQSKQIAIETAKAELESAKLRAEAIKVMGKAAQEYPEYRQQEFIGAFGEALREGNINQIVYVPTEANIPLLEAGKRPVIE